MSKRDTARPGFNLIEVMVAMSTAAVVLLALGGFIVSSFKGSGNEKDRAFAMQRALQMMEELASCQSTGPSDVGIVQFDQNSPAAYSFQLTTAANAVAYSSFSGNPLQNGNYKYVRHITVAGVPSDPNNKQVTVEVYYAKPGTTALPDPRRPKPLAVVSNHIRVSPGTVGATQALDVYVISIENIPHIFRKVDQEYYYPSAAECRLAYDQAMRNFSSAYPGIQLRPHYITRLSKGRDKYYRPYVNSGKGIAGTSPESVNWVYWYPGKIENTADGARIFDEQLISGNLGVGNPGSTWGSNGASYALADQFNHAVLYPQEHTFVNPTDIFGTAAVPANFPQSDSLETMSLRQFLEDLLSDNTGKYRNAIIVNLHGELFPCLPLRPYADPAKDPYTSNATLQQRRIVTHPYRMNFPDTGDNTKPPAKLLVHMYNNDGSNTPSYGLDKVDKVWTGAPYDTNLLGHETGANTWAREARIIIKGLKNNLNPSSTLLDGAVTISAIQRERSDGSKNAAPLVPLTEGGSGNQGGYAAVELWPNAADDADDANRFRHSGPHLKSSHVGAPAPLDVPHWGGPSGNDLIIDLADLDYDCRQFDDGGDHYGIDNTQDKEMLHGLQYFPDPYLEYLDEDGDKQPRNTARLTIDLDLASSAANKRFEVITQLNRSTGYVDPYANPDDPTVSRTYFYAGKTIDSTSKLYYSTGANPQPTIPWTDQVQLVGDPRHVPYADLRENNNVNLYWSNFDNGRKIYGDFDNTAGHRIDKGNGDAAVPSASSASSGSHHHGGGHSHGGHTHGSVTFPDVSVPESHDGWNTTRFNGPAYFRMWREALYRNSAMFVNVGGQAVGYIGLGGEFSLKNKINEYGPINFIASIYNSTGSSEAGRSELDDEVPTIIGGTWVGRPWLGELYPMSQWTNWSTKGNLPTSSYVHENLTDAGSGASQLGGHLDRDEKEDRNLNTKHVSPEVGLMSFLNAPVLQMDVTNVSNQDTQIQTMTNSLAQAFGVPLQELKAEFPYKVSSGTPGTKSTEYSDPFYSGKREPVSALNDFGGITMGGYFTHDQAGYFASNPILLTDISGTRRLVFLANAFRPESIDKMPKVFDNAVATMVESYLDFSRNQSGKTVGGTNNKPLPRLVLTYPTSGAVLTGGSVGLTWTKNWNLPDAKEYSATNVYDGSASIGTGGPLPVVYFVKYRNLNTNSEWQMAKLTSTPAVNLATWIPALPTDLSPYRPGEVPAASPMPTQPSTATGATWDISALAPGEYLLRIEAYRNDTTVTPNQIVPMHFAFNEVRVVRN